MSKHFSVESIYEPLPWGVHKPWLYFKGQDLLRLLPECPELDIILPQKKKQDAINLAQQQQQQESSGL